MASQSQYTLLVETRALAGWRLLETRHPDEMKECVFFLKQHPTNYRVTNGKAKKLKGQLKGYSQYDVTYGDRVRYQVDKIHQMVHVVYAGPHP